MGKRGQKPQPIAVVKDKGYYRPSRHTSAVDDTGALAFVGHDNMPTPPDRFTKEQADIWTRELMHIGKVYGWVGFVDLPMFEQWCLTYDACNKLEAICANEQRVEYTEKGRVVNPIFKELREEKKLLTKLSAEFGLTPSSRRSVMLANKPDEKEQKPKYKL
jgi:P27 family predicted phage terminase small subunit